MARNKGFSILWMGYHCISLHGIGNGERKFGLLD